MTSWVIHHIQHPWTSLQVSSWQLDSNEHATASQFPDLIGHVGSAAALLLEVLTASRLCKHDRERRNMGADQAIRRVRLEEEIER